MELILNERPSRYFSFVHHGIETQAYMNVSAPSHGQCPPEQCTLREVPRIGCSSSYSEFRGHWSNGVPVVVTGVDAQIQGSYGPAYFIAEHGTKKVTLHDCESEKTRSTTVADFFTTFGDPDRKRTWKLKVCQLLCISDYRQ